MARAKQQRRSNQKRRATPDGNKQRRVPGGHPDLTRPTAPHEAHRPDPTGELPLTVEGRARLTARTETLVLSAAESLLRGDRPGAEAALASLVAVAPDEQRLRVVQLAVVELVRGRVRGAWQLGWQPVDVDAWLGRRRGGLTRRLAGSAMADELATYARATVDQDWYDQLDAIEATVWWPASQTWAAAHAGQPQCPWPLVLEACVELVAEIAGLWRFERFLPLPGRASPAVRQRVAGDPQTLQRVRQLLAQAESTTFPGEAETFTAAAQRLMARHSIDAAMLQTRDEGRGAEEPTGRRLWLDRPYVKEKVLLLTVVAEANRVRAVWFKEAEMVTLLGHRTDLGAVETLYTSLLVQASRAVQQEGARVHVDGSSRTRGFRQSFLTAYASRIGERLREASAAETRDAAAEFDRTSGRDLVPVLRALEEEVEAYASRVFPHQMTTRVSAGRDQEGWAKGRRAADRARLSAGPEVTG